LTTVSTCLESLSGLSNKEAMKALKLILAVYNSHPVSNLSPSLGGGPINASGSRNSPRKKGDEAKPKAANKDPEVIKLKGELSNVLKQIKAVRDNFEGGELPEDHPLAKAREQLLASIKDAKSSFRPLPSKGSKTKSVGQRPAETAEPKGPPTPETQT